MQPDRESSDLTLAFGDAEKELRVRVHQGPDWSLPRADASLTCRLGLSNINTIKILRDVRKFSSSIAVDDIWLLYMGP